MKRVVMGLCLAVGCLNASADRLTLAKEQMAEQFMQCADNEVKTGGNAYLNVCYGELADKLEALGDVYSAAMQVGVDNDEAKEIQADARFFKAEIGLCGKYLEVSKRAQHQKTEFANQCKLRAARAYAEYFFRPNEREILAKDTGISHKQALSRRIRQDLGLAVGAVK